MAEKIQIKCGGEVYLSIDEIHQFQGDLKSITKEKFTELKESLKENGLPIGFHVWEDKQGKKWILDGTHRRLALMELRKEGFEIPKVPCNMVKAKSRKEAAKTVLISNSRYAKMSQESFAAYMIEMELGLEDLGNLDIPDIDMTMLEPEEEGDNGVGKSMNEYKQEYDPMNIKQIVLVYGGEEYIEAIELLGQIKKKQGFENNAQAVLWALKDCL